MIFLPRSLESANVENFPGLNVCPEDSQRKPPHYSHDNFQSKPFPMLEKLIDDVLQDRAIQGVEHCR